MIDKEKDYIVLLNTEDATLPNMDITISSSNFYDLNLLSNLQKDTQFIITLSDHLATNATNFPRVKPGIRRIGTLVELTGVDADGTKLKIKAKGLEIVQLVDPIFNSQNDLVYTKILEYPTSKDIGDLQTSFDAFVHAYKMANSKYHGLKPLPDFKKENISLEQIPYYLAVFLNLDKLTKQKLIEESEIAIKYNIVTDSLEKFNVSTKIEMEINSTMNQNLEKSQKEYILREKMRTIRDELNKLNDNPSDEDSIEKYVNEHEKDYPENILTKIRNEIGKIKSMPSGSPDLGISLSYLKLIAFLPYKKQSKDNENLEKVRKILDENHYGLVKQKERIIEYLAVKKLTNSLKAPILCFYGAPGVGKTSLAISIAKALDRKFVKFALGGVNDEAEIRGHRKTYIGAMPGKIISLINKAKVNNPVFLLDEIDKLDRGGYKGDPASALLEVLDPEQNTTFTDTYLDEPFDLSNVLFICTANDISNIPAPLLDRLELIELNTYTRGEKLAIAKEYLIKLEAEANGIKPKMMEYTDEAINYIIEYYTREAGVRSLRRKIGEIDRKFAVEYLKEKSKETKIIDIEAVKKYLGPEIFIYDTHLEESQVGIINGLAYTSSGGEVLQIEATTYPGKGNLILTGSLGDVMKEACSTALSVVKSLSEKLFINSEFFSTHDIHIHFPEGATPKDGPSAGMATTLAIISAITKARIRNDIAITGEIDLKGNAIPIGGLREKSNAASRDHIKTVIIPEKNYRDTLEIPKEVTDTLNYITVKRIEDTFDKVFYDNLLSLKDQIIKETSSKNIAINS